ncbi:ribbon-helix-helix CopG family protein [Propionibacteriaceae bacterium ES.041]|nr:ribbon-helix-helix CopG family protein [Propionibacteriaceae bacterium ES.041]
MAMTLRLDDEHEQAVAALAAAHGTSKHEAILRAIENEAARLSHQEAVGSSSARVRERYADLIERLGQ